MVFLQNVESKGTQLFSLSHLWNRLNTSFCCYLECPWKKWTKSKIGNKLTAHEWSVLNRFIQGQVQVFWFAGFYGTWWEDIKQSFSKADIQSGHVLYKYMVGPWPKYFGPSSRETESKGINKQLAFNVALGKSYHLLTLIYKNEIIKSVWTPLMV